MQVLIYALKFAFSSLMSNIMFFSRQMHNIDSVIIMNAFTVFSDSYTYIPCIPGCRMSDEQAMGNPASNEDDVVLRSEPSTHHSFVRFCNRTLRRADVIWFNYTGQGVKYKTLLPTQTVDVNTFVGHPWMFRDHDTGDRYAEYWACLMNLKNEVLLSQMAP